MCYSKWQSNLNCALKFLKTTKEPIGQFTYQCICENNLKIKPIDLISKNSFDRLMTWHNKESDQFLSGEYPLTKKDVHEFNKRYSGIIFGTDIFINPNLSPKMMSSIIVHEVNHFLLQAPDFYSSFEQELAYEVSAELSEACMEGKRITRNLLFSLASAYNHSQASSTDLGKISFDMFQQTPHPKVTLVK